MWTVIQQIWKIGIYLQFMCHFVHHGDIMHEMIKYFNKPLKFAFFVLILKAYVSQ